MHGGKSPGAPKGNRNAWKHGHYSAEAHSTRRLVRQLLSNARKTVERVGRGIFPDFRVKALLGFNEAVRAAARGFLL